MKLNKLEIIISTLIIIVFSFCIYNQYRNKLHNDASFKLVSKSNNYEIYKKNDKKYKFILYNDANKYLKAQEEDGVITINRVGDIVEIKVEGDTTFSRFYNIRLQNDIKKVDNVLMFNEDYIVSRNEDKLIIEGVYSNYYMVKEIDNEIYDNIDKIEIDNNILTIKYSKDKLLEIKLRG